MTYGVWRMVYGVRPMTFDVPWPGAWGLGPVAFGLWPLAWGMGLVADGAWRIADGLCPVEWPMGPMGPWGLWDYGYGAYCGAIASDE